MSAVAEHPLAPAARLVGQLLLQEIDEARRVELTSPPLSEALSELGLRVDLLGTDANLEELAADFLEAFVKPPTGGPLVQSLWTQGSYEGDAAAAVRGLAQASALEFDREVARGAPQDHLGCILLLWAEADTRQPEVAARLREQHLAWATPPLRRRAARGDFYGSLAGVAADLLDELTAPD